MNFRKVIFWLHLVAGVAAGVVIAVMSFTGVALTYEKQLVAWAERDVRRVAPPAPDATKVPLDQLLGTLRESRPGAWPSGITVSADPDEAVLFSFGRTNTLYANPYTGEVRQSASARMSGFMHVMVDWHRYLGAHGEGRATGKAITGACNAAFLVLAVTGLYLWWPRNWTATALRAVSLMSFKLSGKARDFNWHNAIGLWSAPVLIVLTATALPISYRWAGDLIYKVTGSEPPVQGGPPGAGTGPAIEISKPSPDARPLGMAALVARAGEAVPNWQTITLRTGGGPGREGGAGGGIPRPESTAGLVAGLTNQPAVGREPAAIDASSPGGSPEVAVGREGRRPSGGADAQPVSVTVKERNAWPLFSSVQLTLNPYTGDVLRREAYADQNAGRKVRSWTRFLHTGEALGLIGQGVAGLASFGALVLVWTGFALAWRRFFPRRSATAAANTAGT